MKFHASGVLDTVPRQILRRDNWHRRFQGFVRQPHCQRCQSSTNGEKQGFSRHRHRETADKVEYTETSGDSNPLTSSEMRENILFTCVSTSGILGMVGIAIHAATPYISIGAHQDVSLFNTLYEDSLVGHVGAVECGAMLATAGVVTGVRFWLLQIWPEFKQSTDVANRQIIVPIKDNISDIVVVAAVPAMAEEMLFRWALVPAVSPDWRGAVISGLVFGILHINGGRNSAFAAWASCVGTAYAFLYLYSGSLAVAVGAHALANLLSATVWLQGYNGRSISDDS